ncbi:MAG TPA: protein-L-isoaspartate O-methyltransferase [Sulfurovum sp. UBA12169]|nr:MAG TPA: protein-L-isoaspartate O-methyltransferase [Sulfurovum sp. UBA12169]
MKNLQQLVNSMISSGVLKNPRIIDAFETIDRKYFIPEEFEEYTYVDAPLPIGKNQTISQPTTVAFMLELLSPQDGNRILDIGSGSGWTVALLCYLTGHKGSVVGLERIDELAEMGQNNISKFKFDSPCTIEKSGETLGKPGDKFDRILVSASAEELPEELLDQLEIGGILVIPIQNSIFLYQKISEHEIKQQEYPGFAFVPLIYRSK